MEFDWKVSYVRVSKEFSYLYEYTIYCKITDFKKNNYFYFTTSKIKNEGEGGNPLFIEQFKCKFKWKWNEKEKKITLYRKNKIHRYSFHISKYFLTWKEHSFSILRSISKRQLISSSFSLTAILHSNANENKNARKIFAKIQFSDIHFTPPSPFSFSFLKKEERKKKSITIFHSINLTNTQSLLNTITLLIIHGSNEIVTRRFVQIAWLKSPAQLFGDLKEILVQRDVDVDYRDEPIIFFSAQIPQFAYARNRICPTSRGFNPTPVSLSIYCNVKSEFANAVLASNFVSIRHRYHPDIDLGVRHGARLCVHTCIV